VGHQDHSPGRTWTGGSLETWAGVMGGDGEFLALRSYGNVDDNGGVATVG
jgi:hypothetical protein